VYSRPGMYSKIYGIRVYSKQSSANSLGVDWAHEGMSLM